MASKFVRKVLLGSLCLIVASPAAADIKAGVDAWSRGDYAAAVSEWRGPAERGDPDAQFNLGQAYKLGRGVERDIAKAQELFGQAAAQGHLRAADNYGLLLFQRGDRARATPLVKAAAERGNARAQYLLGIAHFNGEHVEKDWVRAYALVSLAQQAGLDQATQALAQMDQHMPLEQRQQSVVLASQLAAQAEANRKAQVAAFDLGVSESSASTASGGSTPATGPTGQAVTTAHQAEGSASPATAGAGYARQQPSPPPKPATQPKPPAAPVPKPKAEPARSSEGAWRVQLGAFGVEGNAERLWNRVRNRPELAGHARVLEPAGRLTLLLASGFTSRSDAQAACTRLKAGGFDCIAVGR